MRNFLQNWIHIDTKMIRNIVQKKSFHAKSCNCCARELTVSLKPFSRTLCSQHKKYYICLNLMKLRFMYMSIIWFTKYGICYYIYYKWWGAREMLKNRVIYLCFHQTSSFFHNSTSL